MDLFDFFAPTIPKALMTHRPETSVAAEIVQRRHAGRGAAPADVPAAVPSVAATDKRSRSLDIAPILVDPPSGQLEASA